MIIVNDTERISNQQADYAMTYLIETMNINPEDVKFFIVEYKGNDLVMTFKLK